MGAPEGRRTHDPLLLRSMHLPLAGSQYALVALLAVAAYWNSLRNDFTFDDAFAVVRRWDHQACLLFAMHGACQGARRRPDHQACLPLRFLLHGARCSCGALSLPPSLPGCLPDPDRQCRRRGEWHTLVWTFAA